MSTAAPGVASRFNPGPFAVEAGTSHPIGATPDDRGVNFSLFSQKATGIELLLFADALSREPIQVIRLDPSVHKTFHFWHVYVVDLKPGAVYAYRVDGPWSPSDGLRFNPRKVIIDPYSKANTSALWVRGDACSDQDNCATALRSVVIDTGGYDWEGDKPLNRPMADTILYEMHVGGFTRSASAEVRSPGTFAGVIEKIPYLKELGVTAVELLPIADFDETEVLRTVDGKDLHNYWGYSSMSFFAPQQSYCVSPLSGTHLTEFRDFVKAMHRAGIEVILDVVFNHSDEGDHRGPVINFKGVDNSTYYYLSPLDRSYYMNYTGCGNTINCNHPISQKMIVDCLRYWVEECHVDGFRFDMGSILARGENGEPLQYPPVVWQIELDDVLARSKVIAEAWDAAGLYQIGHFPGDRWSEWNGRYRDDVRGFVRGDGGLAGAIATRLAGSSDLYGDLGELPLNSINFVTCHDGFTMNDLVSYNRKHNEANGEGNRDGVDDNLSWNCGIEGAASDGDVEALRGRQVRNFAAILMLSRGVPMMLSGDEMRNTQRGNNNAYCQNNEIGWIDWSLLARHGDIFRFWKNMIEFRKTHKALRKGEFFSGLQNDRGVPDVSWHGCRLNQPGWNDPEARALAVTYAGFGPDDDIHVMMNMFWEPLDFEIPGIPGRRWVRSIDTSRISPEDIADPGTEAPADGAVYRVAGRSIAVLLSRPV